MKKDCAHCSKLRTSDCCHPSICITHDYADFSPYKDRRQQDRRLGERRNGERRKDLD